jgi:dienelactone hydrolase
VPDNTPVLWIQPADPEVYAKVTHQVDRLFDPGGHREALDLLESTWPGLPETELHTSLIDILILKAYFQAQINRPGDSLATLEAMSRCGVSSSMSSPAYDPIRDLPGYAELAQKNEALLIRERNEARVECDVHVPRDLRRGEVVPLMLVLHGDPGNLAKIRDAWPTGAIVSRGIIVAYVQSSQLRSTSRYVWMADPAVARADVRAAFRDLCQRHSVDTSLVILAGFSAGATTALDLVFGQMVPAVGFIGLCAGDIPEHFTRERGEAAKERGVRGVFFEGEENWPDDEEEKMLQTMQEVGLPIELVINKGIGHSAPHDFPEKMERALDFVLGGSPG